MNPLLKYRCESLVKALRDIDLPSDETVDSKISIDDLIDKIENRVAYPLNNLPPQTKNALKERIYSHIYTYSVVSYTHRVNRGTAEIPANIRAAVSTKVKAERYEDYMLYVTKRYKDQI